MAKGYVLSERDRMIVEEVIRQVELLVGRSLRGGGIGGGWVNKLDDFPQQASVYVARVPVGGIPGVEGNYTGTGSDDNPLDDVFSFADCEIYHMDRSDPNIPILKPTGFTRKVYNVSETSVPGNFWVITKRDQFGTWWTEVQGEVPTGADTLDVVTCVEILEVNGSAIPGVDPSIAPLSIASGDIADGHAFKPGDTLEGGVET